MSVLEKNKIGFIPEVDKRKIKLIAGSTTWEDILVMSVEHLADLQKQLCKQSRGYINSDKVLDGIAEAYIWFEVIEQLFDFSSERLHELIKDKLAQI